MLKAFPTVRDAMYEIDHEFEQVPVLATDKDGKQMAVAFLDGRAVVTPYSGGTWDINEITLYSPIDVAQITIDPRNPLWGVVHESVERHCGDSIWHKVSEFISEAAE